MRAMGTSWQSKKPSGVRDIFLVMSFWSEKYALSKVRRGIAVLLSAQIGPVLLIARGDFGLGNRGRQSGFERRALRRIAGVALACLRRIGERGLAEARVDWLHCRDDSRHAICSFQN